MQKREEFNIEKEYENNQQLIKARGKIVGRNGKRDANQREEEEARVINWIDSKAMFGDEETHVNDVLPQVVSYVNRYGPGLVIYWFGYVDSIANQDPQITILDHFPEQILLPDGTCRYLC